MLRGYESQQARYFRGGCGCGLERAARLAPRASPRASVRKFACDLVAQRFTWCDYDEYPDPLPPSEDALPRAREGEPMLIGRTHRGARSRLPLEIGEDGVQVRGGVPGGNEPRDLNENVPVVGSKSIHCVGECVRL